jgi:ADP-ribose pyrophosphatase YjhB (NUDIX family)
MISNHFCLKCGTLLKIKRVEGREREVCPACGWVYYEQIKLSAGCLIEQEDRVLLVQRAYDPWLGCWHLPSGFVEIDENPIHAAEREVLEETGLTVEAGRLVNVFLYQDDPRGNGLILIYEANVLSGQPTGSAETLDCRFFAASEVGQLPLAGQSGMQEIQEWLDRKRNGHRHE